MTSDKLYVCDIKTLLKWILEDEKKGRIFGIEKDLFFVPKPSDPFRMHRYGHLLETPVGVAAGPHTQLSQNLIAAWLTGGRYIELKTIQILDELEVTKPCIDMGDEGYNCEWSQELKLDESFDEYLNAWIIMHILKDKFGWGEAGVPGFIFNMSVGYNLEGILSPTVQRFLDRMADCSKEKAEKIEQIATFYPRVKELQISDCMSDNVTVSTMHGCPPDEVEKIGRYFVEERKLHTTIKLNPTLLGDTDVRGILNTKLGFKVQVPDLAFDHDLKYPDGVALIKSLLESAKKIGVEFNIKLTNTLETTNKDQNLPDNEQMVYMSGRALHPISINLARRLQDEFKGKLDISFSAGTSYENVGSVLACDLKPITTCSDLLRPGGYGRLSQYLETLEEEFAAAGAKSIDEFVVARSGKTQEVKTAGWNNLQKYAAAVVIDGNYKKESYPYDSIKTETPLGPFDCIKAPCMSTCPASQDIPSYLYYTAQGDYEKARKVILETNPFPNIQGMVCDHLCQSKCTRINYDNPLLIREIKRFVIQTAGDQPYLTPAASNGIKVGIIGAGPSGLSCAYFLALQGFDVEIFESKKIAGGWASDAIPTFRLDDDSIKKDIDAILSLGVKIHYSAAIDQPKFDAMVGEFDYIYVAIGAQEGVKLGVPGEDAEGVWDNLDFLSAVRRGEKIDLGKKVVIIGGGNSAMDAARTAKRLVGPDGEVNLIYRRTKEEMPAALEEVIGMLDEEVNLIELTAPECMLVQDGRVKSNRCFQMKLGPVDDSGRPRPIKIEGSEFELEADSVITAIGQRVNADFFPGKKLNIDPVTHETQIKNVFAGGDATRGASTLIKAIADGKHVAESIVDRAVEENKVVTGLFAKSVNAEELRVAKARRQPGTIMPEIGFDERSGFKMVIKTLDEATAQAEAARCLQCDEICSVCVSVCPNRANVEFQMEPVSYTVQQAELEAGVAKITDLESVQISQKYQILNIGDFCNECGNCATFCPTSGAPYKDKPKFHITRRSFDLAEFGYMFSADNTLKYKNGDQNAVLVIGSDSYSYEDEDVRVVLNSDYSAKTVEFKNKQDSVNLQQAVYMAVLSKAVGELAFFNGAQQA
ncbi:putative selenate reductase subunit YgfK [Desulforhopalus sp. IMCC35007]|uniref:putative selenate reductase subunit YgfK n=1 Tax=Desulforhopalus sp. IMCC35007 TaxID=2569543 RepID=UPI0010AE10E7|nr:putative selenate reductase subunit YgfK [Desulforhopalus sp. IMCC35007]TKB06776.1 putative selenate reductase subunit YgfK [Desulforhopalus sp. IMCC35007]